MRRVVFSILVGMFVFLVGAGDGWAQATAQITGTVRDQTGAVMPGVEIAVKQTQTGVARSTVTNETGSYILPSLPLGPYELEAALPGFQTFVQRGIVLQVNSSPAINIVLQVGQVTETTEVVADAALVETRSVGIGQVVETSRILELPLDGRQVTELISLAGGAVPTSMVSAGGTSTGRNPFSRPAVSVAGGTATGLNYSLDGANHNDPFQSQSLSLPFPDALQEFKVETSATSAQSGVRPAGSVSLVTKSGTNQFHGNLFEFVRNYKFNARNFFATRRDTMKRNQFGGTVGGPILQNKLFFFAGYQGSTIRQDPPVETAYVPTPAMLAGDFSTFASGQCQRRPVTLSLRDANGNQLFNNNRVDPALLSPAAKFLSSKLPASASPCGEIMYGIPQIEDRNMIVSRIDYQQSTNHTIFGRYLRDYIKQPTSFARTGNLLTAGAGIDGASQAFTLGFTSLFGPNVVNSIRLSANRFTGGYKSYDKTYKWSDLGVKAYTYDEGMMDFSVSGGFAIGFSFGPSKMALFGINDDVSLVRGNHQFGFGFHSAAWWTNSYSSNYSRGRGRFSGVKTGLGMPDFLLGYADEWAVGAPGAQHKRSKYIALYGNDTWKLTPRVTLNYGVRWEPYFPMINIDDSAVHFDVAAMKTGTESNRFKNTPAGLFFSGDPGFPGQQGMYNQWWNISPRVGLAWDVQGDGRASVRTSIGTFFDYPDMYYQIGLNNAPPWQNRTQTRDVRLDDPWATWPGGDPHPVPYGRNVSTDIAWQPFSIVTAMDYESPNARVTHWNLALQRQVGEQWLVSASYIGNATRHMWGTQPINPGVFVPGNADANGRCSFNGQIVRSLTLSPGSPCTTTGNINQRRVFMLDNSIPLAIAQGYGAVNRIDTGGTASYNGLVLSVQRRATDSITISGNYTWSHCISNWWNSEANSGDGTTSWQTADRSLERGNCVAGAADRRHIFNTSVVAETPQFSNRALKAVASNWRLSPIFRVLSGAFMEINTRRDPMFTGVRFQRVDQVMEDVYGAKTITDYLNPAAFRLPTVGKPGNLGQGSVLGPGTWQFDVALSREFPIGETQKFELRAEAFNLTNGLRVNNPDTTFESATFGQVRTARDPRIMQFALKYFF